MDLQRRSAGWKEELKSVSCAVCKNFLSHLRAALASPRRCHCGCAPAGRKTCVSGYLSLCASLRQSSPFFVVFLTLFICRISLHFTSRLLTNNLTTQLHSLHTHPSNSTPPLPAASLSLRLLCAVSVTSIYLCGRLVATQLWETPRVARRVQKVLLCRGGVSLREMMGQAQLRRRAR